MKDFIDKIVVWTSPEGFFTGLRLPLHLKQVRQNLLPSWRVW